MKTQVQNLYDPLTTAPYTVFKKIGSNKFFVNSQCILSAEKIITIGKEYVVIDNTKNTGIKIRSVSLVDTYYRRGILHLILRDIRSQKVYTRDHGIEYPEMECNFVLIDLDYFKNQMNVQAVRSYCGCCYDPKKITNTDINHRSCQDDLLQFDF